MPRIVVLDPSVLGAPAATPLDRWGATTVGAAAITNALHAVATPHGAIGGVIVVSETEPATLRGELARFARIHGRNLSDPHIVATTAEAERYVAGDDETVLVGWLDQPTVSAELWRALAGVEGDATLALNGERGPVHIVNANGTSTDWRSGETANLGELSGYVERDAIVADDARYVEECLGRTPQAAFTIAARRPNGRPTVIENPPFLADGRPMPTTFWLIDPELNRAIGTIEAGGGVDAAEEELGLDVLAEAHNRYAAYRDSLIPADHDGYRPSGGVGGTRVGVKCLHTHYAWYLTGGADPVGQWVHRRLLATDGAL